jgi:hypothetical protein
VVGRALARALEGNGALTRLDVRGTQIGAVGMLAIGEALIRARSSRLGLLACDAFAVEEATTELAAHGLSPSAATLLAGVLKANTTVESLGFHGVDLLVKQLKGAVDGKGERPLESLQITDKGLGTASGVVVARLVESNTSLRELNLRNNNLGVGGAVAIGKALERNATLTTLSLAGNALCGMRFDKGTHTLTGILALASALTINKRLASLSLASTQGDESSGMGPQGAAALAGALQTNVALTELNLQYNTNIGLEGLRALASALLASKTLCSVNFSSMRLGTIGIQVS